MRREARPLGGEEGNVAVVVVVVGDVSEEEEEEAVVLLMVVPLSPTQSSWRRSQFRQPFGRPSHLT